MWSVSIADMKTGPAQTDPVDGLQRGVERRNNRIAHLARGDRLSTLGTHQIGGAQTVGQYFKATGTTPIGFTMFVVGEGIEKKQDDFAAEVAAQVAAASKSA